MRKLLALLAAAVAFAAPAQASFGPSAVLFHPTNRITTPLSAVSGVSVIGDLDATLGSSYNGSGQTWANLITSPADGTTQAANSFNLGTTSAAESSDPTLSGTASSTQANWSMNGSTYFTLAGANSAFLNTMQNDSENWWIAISFNLASNSGYSILFATQNTTSSAGIAIAARTSGTPSFSMNQYTTASTQFIAYTPTPAPAAGQNYLLIVSHNAGGHTRLWLNNTSTYEQNTSFTSGSINATHAANIGTRNNGTTIVAGSVIRSFAYGTDYLSSTQAGTIIHALENRHQIDYDGNGIIGN